MRRKTFKPVAILLTLLIATQGLIGAASAGINQTQESEKLLPEFYRKFGRDWIVKLSADGQRVETILGRGTQVYPGQPAEAARQFLRDSARFFGLKEDLSDLNLTFEKSSLGGASVEFQQIYSSLPVENAHVQVNLNREARVLQVVSSYTPKRATTEQPTINRERALEIALNEFLRTTPAITPSMREEAQSQFQTLGRDELTLKEPPRIDDIFFVKDNRPARAYKVLIYAIKPFGIKVFVIDAASGAILQVEKRDQTIDGTGQVFNSNPINSTGNNRLNATNVPITNPNPYFTVSLPNLITPASGPFTLKGPFVSIEDIESPTNTPASDATNPPSFVYHRDNADFGDVMLYYHLDRAQRYIQSLGFVDINNRQIRADSHGFSDFCNAHYVPMPLGAGYLGFGGCAARVAEDAEVILHEYGHSIQDNQTNGKYLPGGFPASMSEGFGDYLGASFYLAEAQAGGTEPACVGEWGITLGVCLRRVDGNLTRDNYNPLGDPHVNGEIWSRTLWDILTSLGKTTADRLILQSHFNVPTNPDFKLGADAIMTADLQLYSGSHLNQLCTVFTDRRIYHAGDCPSLPPSTGTNQNTLVVLARFNDSGLPTSPIGAGDVTTLINNINSYLNEVTYAQVSLGAPNVQGWLNLPRSRSQYYDQTSGNMLIEMGQDVIAALHGVPFSSYDRMIILTNDTGLGGEERGLKEWATTGSWPYTLPWPYGTKHLSVSIHRADQAANIAQFTHAMGHHFGLIDLYPHEGVTFARPYADGWGNMAKDATGNFNNTHFFGWDKLKPTWLTNANVQFIPRPPADAIPPAPPDPNSRFDQTLAIFREELNTANPVLIQIGTTPGATRETERVSYYIEARKKLPGTFDSNIPSDGVLIYYLNEDIGQGFGPLRLVDATLDTPNDLADAAFRPFPGPSTVEDIDGTGLRVEVLPPTGFEDYRIHITYDPHETDVDVWINPRDVNWQSQDIWVDSPGDNMGTVGFDLDATPPRTESDRRDKPRAREVTDPGPPIVNRAYARVYNRGPDTAHNVRVDFYFSDPYHVADGGAIDPETGGNTGFNKRASRILTDVPPTQAGIPVFVEWTPERVALGQRVHSCIKVKIAHVFNDTNDYNQTSQENTEDYDIVARSPYPPVISAFRVVNPYAHPIFVYLRADNVPVGWTTDIVPQKAYLPVGGSVDTQITIQAPIDYPVCSTEFVKVSAWYPSGDTLIELGASTARVNLKKSTELTITTNVESCNRHTLGIVTHSKITECAQITAMGCTNPARPNEHITLEYTGLDGNPVYHDVITDAHGCFEDFLVNPQGGIWTVQAEYPGNDCTSRTNTPKRAVFVLPGGTQNPGGYGRGKLWLSFHLGMNFPLSSFNRTHDPGPSMTLNAEYPFRENLSAVGYLGFHYFHGDGGNPNFHYTNVSLNLKQYFPVSSFRGYVEAGPGVYFPKFGPTKFGFNVGTGFSFAIQPGFKFELGPDLHFVDPGGSQRVFVDARMGVAFRF